MSLVMQALQSFWTLPDHTDIYVNNMFHIHVYLSSQTCTCINDRELLYGYIPSVCSVQFMLTHQFHFI